MKRTAALVRPASRPLPHYTCFEMTDRVTDAEIELLDRTWENRFDGILAMASWSARELTELAERHRSAAQATDSSGQRRAFVEIAERYERAARDRSAVRE